MNILGSEELYYSQNGEWVQVDENLATIGLTDFRLNQLGEVLYVDLPEEGKPVRQGESFFSIESVKHIHDFVAPVSGTIIDVNLSLYENPETLNDAPYTDGWIIKIEMDNEHDLAKLVRTAEYKHFTQKASNSPRDALTENL